MAGQSSGARRLNI